MAALDLVSDEELVALIKAGSRSAFAKIHERYYELLYRHALKKLHDEFDVEDILQDLFISLWHNRETLNLSDNLASYLYAAVKNRVLNCLASKKIRNEHLHSLQQFIDGDSGYITDALIRKKELTLVIEKEISSLPSKMQTIFEMSRNECLSHKEIGEQLQLSPKTVKKQVNNALKILRMKLETFMLVFFL